MPSNRSLAQIVFIENENINRDSSGGVMSYILNLSSYFITQGFKTILIGSGKLNPDKKLNVKFSNYYSISENQALSNLKFLIKLFKTNKLNRINKKDIIHVQRAEMVIPIALRKRNKIICTLHGGQDLAVLKKKGKLMAFFYLILQYFAFKMVDKLIVVDKKNLDRYIKKYPWIRDKIHLIPISVDINKFHPKNKLDCKNKFNLPLDKKILLFIGRLEYEKNIEFIINGFKGINNNACELVIVGSGSLEDELKGLADLDNNEIKFLGELENTLIPELINCADVLLLTSFFEGSPTVIKEALCCNVPVISTDVGDVKDVLKLVDGGEIIDFTIDSFVSAINTIIAKENISINDAPKLFSHTLMGKKTLTIYERK